MKATLKRLLLDKAHAIDIQQFTLADLVASRGVKEYIGLNYAKLQNDILSYVRTLEIAPFTYKYSASRERPCLYASIYAVMIEGLFGVLNNRGTEELQQWGEYLNSFQNPVDGIYYDPVLAGPDYEHKGVWNEGWGKHHLMGHIIIALSRLGVTPKYPFKYLEDFYDKDYLINWMEGFDFAGDVWTVSNYFMNLYSVLEYARDYMQETRANQSIELMVDWLLKKQNPSTGMWHDEAVSRFNTLEKLKVVRAAYHFYPLFEYEGIEVPYAKEIVNTILPLQNRWGAWTVDGGNSGACEDIDAIDPLVRYASACPERSQEIETAVRRSMVWQLACRNEDKGFSFYLHAQQEYGGHPVTTSLVDESSMFATWFRTLCLAYEMQFLGIENHFNIGRFPGYELKMRMGKYE